MAEQRHRRPDIVIRLLEEGDLATADRIMRVAFGTLAGVREPAAFFGDAAWIPNRWRADRGAGFAALVDGEIVGSNLATRWGSFGFFGPLTVRPDLWDRGIGRRLMEPVMNLFSEWKIALAGLFTAPHLPKHLGMYQKFGFHPRYLTAVMSKPAGPATPGLVWSLYSQLSGEERIHCLEACAGITHSLYEGLDLSSEIRTICAQDLGDTLLLWDESELAGFAACHSGAGTEAGSGRCYMKFAAVRPTEAAPRHFDELLAACEVFAVSRKASRLVAGVNTAREEAYKKMLQRGFGIDIMGVAMHIPNEPGFSRTGVYVLDDWR